MPRGGGRAAYIKAQRAKNNQSIPNYHAKAQTFIKDAKSKGMTVKAEGGELIATPKNLKPKAKAPTPFQMIGKAADSIFHSSAGSKQPGMYSGAQRGAARGIKAIAKPVKKTPAFDTKAADRKLKGFKYGVGVGP